MVDCFYANADATSINFVMLNVPVFPGSTFFFKSSMSYSLGKSLAERINVPILLCQIPIYDVRIAPFLCSSYTLKISSNLAIIFNFNIIAYSNMTM